MSQNYTCSVVAWVKADSCRSLQVLVKKELDTMSVREMFFCKFLSLEIMNQPERRNGSRKKTQTTFHPFRRSEGKLSLMEHVLKRMDGKFLMTLEDNKIMSVAFMITEEEVLAMNRIYLLPIFESKLDRRKRRMSVDLITEAMLFQKFQDLCDSFFSRHFPRLLA